MKDRTYSVILIGVFISMFLAGVFLPDKALGITPEELAQKVLDTSRVQGGLVIHVGCGDGKLTAVLGAHDSFLVQGLDTNPKNVAVAREYIQSQNLYGKVSVARLSGKQLPFIDNLANLVVSRDLGEITFNEAMRVLAPNGVLYLIKEGRFFKAIKPRPQQMDEWTHFLHDASNNAVAHDSFVGPPRHLQWVGSPRWARHHDHMASMSALVSSNGRIFYIFDEGPTASIALPPKWKLIARDAFNGVILWKQPIEKWHIHYWPLKSGPALLTRRLVAIGDTVYATLGLDAPVTALDAASGETIRTYKNSEATEEIIAIDGILYLIVGTPGQFNKESYLDKKAVVSDVKDARWGGGEKTVMAFAADTGKELWQQKSFVVPSTLAADSERVYFHNGKTVVSLDRKTGKEAWQSESLPVWSAIQSWYAPTLVVYNDLVLFSGGEKMIPHRGGKDTMTALAAKTGKTLWKGDHGPTGYQSSEDLLVANGLVWSGATTSGGYDGVFTGLDPQTGEQKNQFPPDVDSYWFHHRCYRSKGTDRYLLTSRTGIEFLDLQNNHWMIHHWVRGGCLYGIMPCNGLIYAPMHDCACYPEAKLYGFNALASRSTIVPLLLQGPKTERLEKGPAYEQPVDNPGADRGSWPMYRRDTQRSGKSDVTVSAQLKPAWKQALGGKLSSIVVAQDKLFVASVDTHTVHALEATTGNPIWSYTAGSRVDSPPTIYQGRVFFGSADGYVYCLRADDGQLIWRYRAAPADRRHVAFEQVESVWPVHGSVLIQDDVLYCVAGRNMFLDGGLRMLRLEPRTGRKISETSHTARDPETNTNLQNRVQILNMPVALPDILSSDGKRVYMKSQVFDLEGNRLALGPHSGNPAEQGSVQQGAEAHLFSSNGFTDGSWFHRSYWVYGRSVAGGHAGYHQAGKFAPAGRIMTFDDTNVYAFARKPQYYRWTSPLEYHLYSANKQAPAPGVVSSGKGGSSMIQFENTPTLNPTGKALAVEAWVKADKPNGVIVARGGPAQGYALLLQKGKPTFVIRSNQKVYSVSANQRTVKQWVHLAGVLTKDKELQIYINGKLVGSTPSAALIASEPQQKMEFGLDDAGSVGEYKEPFAFTGMIDEVRILYGTVTAEEIAAHADKPGLVAAQNAKLVLCCTFDQGKARDTSGNKHHGKIGAVKAVAGKFGQAMQFTGRGSGKSSGSRMQFHWSQEMPLIVRAMVLADKTLFIAGPPDVVDEEAVFTNLSDPEIKKKIHEQRDALEGKKGAMLWALSIANGKKLAEYNLETTPAWDGMAAAYGKLYLTTTDGQILCFAGQTDSN
jgi:outer membrane protein assembly factor BamB